MVEAHLREGFRISELPNDAVARRDQDSEVALQLDAAVRGEEQAVPGESPYFPDRDHRRALRDPGTRSPRTRPRASSSSTAIARSAVRPVASGARLTAVPGCLPSRRGINRRETLMKNQGGSRSGILSSADITQIDACIDRIRDLQKAGSDAEADAVVSWLKYLVVAVDNGNATEVNTSIKAMMANPSTP
jgi:hypothetical protein